MSPSQPAPLPPVEMARLATLKSLPEERFDAPSSSGVPVSLVDADRRWCKALTSAEPTAALQDDLSIAEVVV